MSDTVQSALEKRKKKQQAEQQARVDTYKKEQESVTAALKAREKRIASSIDSVASDLNSRLDSVIKSYNDSISVKPSFGAKVSDVYNNQRQARMDVSNLLMEVEAYRKHFGDEATDSAVATLKEIQKGHDSILDQAQLMSQWPDEDSYNAWKSKEDQYSREKTKVMEAEDFHDYNQYVSNVKYGIGGKPYFADDTYAYINNPTVEDKRWGGGQTTARELIKSGDRAYKWDTPLRGSESSEEKNSLDYLDADEISIYNYYYAKEGKERADEYLALIQERLNQRKANIIVKDIKSIDSDVLRTLGTGVFGFNAGVDNWASGTKQFFTGEQLPTTAIQYANAEIYNSLDGFGKYAYSATNVIGNMAPSILASSMAGILGVPAKLAQGVGALTMGVSAAGGAYADALEKGYDKGHARVYSTLVGAAEGGLQYLLGGIGKLGGVGTEKLIAKAAMIDNALLRIPAKLGIDLLGEIGEEELQNFLEPALRMIIFGEDYDAPTIDELLETAIVTAITTPIMGGVDTIVEDYSESKYYKDTYGASQNELTAETLEIDPDSAYAQKLQAMLDDGKNLNGNQLRRLVEQNESAMTAQDMSTIQSAAASRLTELGETGDVAAIAAALTKQAAGEKLSRSERQAIASSKYGQRVANELNVKNIESGTYSSAWAENLDTQRINAQEYSRLVEAAQQPQEAAETTGGQVVTDTPKVSQEPNVAPVEPKVATVLENRTVADNATVKESLPVAEESSVAQEKPVTLEEASQKYGAQAKAMIHTYQPGQDVAKFDKAYQAAYDMGKAGVNISYALQSETTSYLTEAQRGLAYEAGEAASNTAAHALDAQNKAAANGKVGRKKGVVRGEGVTIADLKQTFNDTQGKAYKYLSTVAEVTGIDIVLYRSEAGPDGKFREAQGKYSRSEPGTIYIDLNAGLSDIKNVDDLAKYAMLRTFSHEFTHFIEKWNPIYYNELRKVVFDTLTERKENVHDLIEAKQARNPGMSYDKASREVVAEAMTDILPDSNFVQELANNHKTIFQKLLDKLKEFVDNLSDYFNSIGHNRSKEANALKEQVGETVKYLENIVQMFDKAAVQAVENYQATVATEEVVVSKNENTTTVSDTTTVSKTEIVEKTGPAVEESIPAIKETETKVEEKPAETPVEAEPVAQMPTEEPVYDPNDPYAMFADTMGKRVRFEHGNFVYRVQKAGPNNSKWQGRIDAADISASGVYITNARGIHYASELYDTYEEAKDDIVAVARISKLLDEKPSETTKPKEEVTDNGENADNQEPAQQPVTDRSGAAPVLDELRAEDVSGDGGEGDPVADAGERGQQTVRHDLRDDAERNERGHGEGSSQSGDLRGSDRVTESVTDTNVGDKQHEQLHEEVTEQIAQQSTEQPKGRNFVIGDSLDLPNGEKSRYKANVEAIRLVKKLEAEGRYATEAEQVVLSKYVGWGGLANAFSDKKADWAKEYKELKELLTDEEYSSARGSTLNAHYTDISVIKAMYDGLKQLGFTGGRMLEPSSGVGNFVGAMPADMSANVRSWTMVELDGITGLIAKYLYPNSDVRIQGFEKAKIPNDFMDVAIGNVPFGNYAIADKTYPKKVTSAIHNYFFAKSLDKVRPGGIVMFITSSYTMNSKDSTVRRYIMQKADLLGAIRLPDSAFKGNAGTEVVTDILILKKRAANTAYSGEEFLEAPWTYPVKGSYNGEFINSYFAAHPEMVLGTPAFAGSMYRSNSLTYKALEGKGSLADQIREAFKNIQGKMEYPAQRSPEKTNFAVEKAGKKTKNNGLVVKDGKVYQNKNGNLQEVTVAKGAADRIAGMLEIRDAAKTLIAYQQQGLKESEIKNARQKLNKVYDAFVAKHGFINAPANRNAIKVDPDSYSILALENWNPETKKAVKADIFSKNTIAPNRTITSAKDVAEGLIVSINQTGGVDVPLIAKLTDKTEADVTRELIDSRAVFKNREGKLETAEVYLSGNVRAKLRDAEALAPMDADYQKNVEALKAVVPEDVGYQDIFVNVGSPWIPDSVYSDFAAYMLGTTNSDWRKAVDVTRNKDTGNFTVELINKYLKTNSYNTQKWGTSRRSFLDLIDAMLNSKSVVVKNKTDDGKSVIDKDATAAANEKVENIQKEFQEWLWKDEGRRVELATLYNETFNSIVTPKYNGDNLTVNGANAMKPLRPHQRDAVQRIISSGGNTLLAHKVGAGKTYEMAAAAMKLKQLGLVKKPLFAVPKPLVAQWGNEFMDFFPTAKLLVAEASDFTATNRKIFANRIANGDYDAIIMSYEQFEKLPISADFARELYQEQIDSVILAIEEAKAEKGGKSLSVKDLEKKRKSLQTKIDKLTDSAKDEDNIEFEQLGVDSIFVDEAHNFKNLFYTTSMSNVSGLSNKDGAKRSFDLYTKVRYLQKLNGGRGIVFATATPVMNSMSEMYIMQRYLQPDLLEQLGLSTFDAWAKQFGEVVNGVEIKPSGQGYRVKQSFSRFKNMNELQLLFRNFADVLTDIPGLKIPKMKGGKVNVVVCEPGQFQQDYMKELEKRADNIKNVDPTVDNMLKITSDGRKISYTQRMIDPSLPYEEGCKIYRCADNVVKAYNDSKAVKGTQLIFCDMATPKGKSKTADTQTEEMETDMENTRLYDDIKARLMKGGIPAKEIAFIHDADTDAKKKKLFADVNEGKVRVLIGSTGKMGVGMNAQKRIVAIHHLDAPWRPGDVEQRNGRAFRQGNINEEVENFTYVTEGSFDARLWDILDRKQSFINQIMNGENVGRETEDTGEVTLSAAEVKALASGSPLIMEQVQLDTDIKKLESLRRAHHSAVANAYSRLQADKGKIATLEKMVANGNADVASIVDTYSEGKFSITIGNKKFTEKKDAGAALMAAATAKANEDNYTTVAKFAGFELRVIKTHEGIKGLISGKQSYFFNTYPNNTTHMINHLIARIGDISTAVSEWEQELANTQKDMAEQEALIKQPFAKQAELDQKRARYNEVMDILNPKEEQALDSMAEDDVQYQNRDYFEGWESYELSDEFLREVKYADRHPFLRSLANQTVGIEEGTTRHIVIKSSSTLYFFNATGYMNGSIDRKLRITSRNQAKLDAIVKEYVNETDTGTETLNQVAKTYELQRGRDGWDYDAAGYSRASGQNDDVDVETSESDSLGSYWDNYGYNSWEELIEAVKAGAMIMDENGDLINAEQLQQRTDTLTDREVLTLAASQVKVSDLTDAEKNALNIFQQRLAKLETLQAERIKQGQLYKEQQFGAKVDRDEAAKTLNRMRTLDGQIQKASAEVLSVEEKTVLKRVLQKARTVVEEQERQHGKEILDRWRDRRNNADAIKKYRDRLRGDVDELINWVLHPDNKNQVKHIPDALKNTVIPFLSSINFESKRSLAGGNPTKADKAMMDTARKLVKVMENTGDVDELYSNYTDLPPDFMANLRSFMDTAQEIIDNNSGDFVINQMTVEELKKLSKVVRTLKKYIMQMNRFHVNAMFKHVYDAGNSSIDFMDQLKPAENTGTVSQFLLWQQMRPAYAFERFGEGGMAIYDGLRRGQAKLAFNTNVITKFSEKAYTEAEVKAWENEVKTITINPTTVVKMRVSQIMSLYELSKREQAKGHILGDGIRVATFKNGRKKISDVGHKLTQGELNTILNVLTTRQKEVADNLQQFMQKQGGEWGNYVTVARFGEKQFGEENYFPINSDGRHLSVDADEKPGAASLYALLNMGFTKQTQEKAKNRIIVYSIFDVFANHMASMAQYNAFALPIVDALKWFNYQTVETDDKGNKMITGSVREQMDRAFGVPEETRPGSGRQGYAQNFVINIIKALNGTEAQGVPTDAFGVEALHRYNIAQVAFNFRVVVQQPLAITRAGLLIDYSSIIKGVKLSPAAIKKNIAEMQEYSGIAAWKALGFYDVNISRGLTDIIKHDKSPIDKINEVGMAGAELADTLTWAGIWSACKEEVIRKQKLTPKDKGFYDAVTKLFEDVIYKTQVVDSVLTKNEYLRSKGFLARLYGSFMSEPTTTVSMLVDAADKYNMDMQRGMTIQQAWKKNRDMIGRTIYVFALGGAILAAVQAVADALRDDDDYETFLEKWADAFGENLWDELNPLNKLPVVKELSEFAKEVIAAGWDVDVYGQLANQPYVELADKIVKGVQILRDKMSGEKTNYEWYAAIYNILQGVSGFTGLPMAAATREVVTIWNNTIGAMAPSLRVVTYESTADETNAALLEALIEGNQKEVDRISAKYEDEDAMHSGLRSAVKSLYLSGDVDKMTARKYLMMYADMDLNDTYWALREWDHVQETGSSDDYRKYGKFYEAVESGKNLDAVIREYTENGVDEQTLRGQITDHFKPIYLDMPAYEKEKLKARLLDALVASGSFLADAEDIISEWDFEAEHGNSYNEMVADYKDGDFSKEEMKAILIERGLSAEDAEDRMSGWDFETKYGFSYSSRDKAYKEGKISAAELRTAMIEFGDMTETEADNYIRAYDWQIAHPQYSLTVSDVLSYTKPIEALGYSVEDYGISPNVYVEYKNKASKCKGKDEDGDGRADNNTVKNEKMAVIDALPLSVEQKDALYYLNGWAKSKLYQAPWH